jgi:transposase
MIEIAMGRGQTSWHLVHALDGPRGAECLFVGEGRKEKNLRRLWKWFGKQRARQSTPAVMDMWQAFRRSFEAHCPGVGILYDKFHVIPHLRRTLHTVRKQEFKRAGKTMKGLLCGKKCPLLSRQAYVQGKVREALTQLLRANRRLFKAHLLKESVEHLRAYRSKIWARTFLAQWVEQLKWSRLEPYRQFAQMGGEASRGDPRLLRHAGLPRLHRGDQPEGPEHHPSGLRLPGQREHEA